MSALLNTATTEELKKLTMEEVKKIAAQEGWGLEIFHSPELTILNIARDFEDPTSFCLKGYYEEELEAKEGVCQLAVDGV